MIQITSNNGSNVVYTIASGTLVKSDYAKMLPLVEDKIKQFGKIRWYFEMNDFKGWKPDSFLLDLQFDLRHARDFERVAMVGDKKWQEWITDLMKPFTSAAVKYFSLGERQKAKEWLEASASAGSASGRRA